MKNPPNPAPQVPPQVPRQRTGSTCEACEVRPAVTRLVFPQGEDDDIRLCDPCLQDARALGLVDDHTGGGAQ